MVNTRDKHPGSARRKTRLIGASALLFPLLLLGVDFLYNPRLPAVIQEIAPAHDFRPSLVLTSTHLCCSGCLRDLTGVLQRQFGDWWTEEGKGEDIHRVRKSPPPQPAPGTEAPAPDSSGTLTLSVRKDRISQIDLVRLHDAIRKSGIAPQSIALTGIPHFRLTASAPYLCCARCREAVEAQFLPSDQARTSERTQDPHRIGPPYININLHQVVVEFRNEADVTLFLRQMEQAGFEPAALSVTVLDNGL